MKKAMKILALAMVAILLSALVLPAFADSGKTLYVNVKNGGKLNLRSAPSTKGTVIIRIPDKTPVTVLAVDGSWCKVKANGRTGYVRSTYLSNVAGESSEGWSSANRTMYINTGNSGGLRMRKSPNTKAAVMGTYKNGTAVKVTAVNKNWAKVTVDGTLGYMHLSYLTSTKPEMKEGDEDPVVTEKPAETVKPAATVKPETSKTETPSASTMYVSYGSTGTVGLRAEAETGAQILARFPTGTPVTVKSVTNGWAKVKVQGMNGYMLYKYLSAKNPVSTSGTATVINKNGASYANLRSAKTLQGEDTVLAHVKVGSTVNIISYSGGWYKVSYKEYVGYIHRSFIER